MCGIAGIVALTPHTPVPAVAVQRMARALVHRGPDDEGVHEGPGLLLANRRLSIVGLADGRQPITNEDRTIATVFNGELFDFREARAALEARGHRFSTHCDTELIPHLWEDHGTDTLRQLRGQYALAVHDGRRERLVLARDRFGICPLFYTRQDDGAHAWLLFASEIKGLLASGMVKARADLRGIDQVFNFFAVPGPATCFEGISALQPGRYLELDLRDRAAPLQERTYWAPAFPPRGEELDGDSTRLTRTFEELLLSAVEHRLRADVPVVCYLSGGVDSSLVTALASTIRGAPTPTFTVQVRSRRFDESSKAAIVSRHLGAQRTVVPVDDDAVVRTYPELVRAAEAPVIDTAAAATLLLAREVHHAGYKVALAGEGADEWLGGYPWHKVHRLIEATDLVPGLHIPTHLRRWLAAAVGVAPAHRARLLEARQMVGHHSAFHDVYALMAASRYVFFRDETLEALREYNPYLALAPDLDALARWHPLNQSAYWAARIHLPGHLLSLKGDRPAMHSSVETRYPFLDERVFDWLATVHPKWRLRGFRDKYLLRRVAERYLPREIAWRRKMMFRAPLDSFAAAARSPEAAWVDALLTDDALRQTGWFRADHVHAWRARVRDGRVPAAQRTMVQLGLVGVVTSQLWYHTFVEPLGRLD